MTKNTRDSISEEEYGHIKEDIADIKLSLRGVMEILQRFAVMEERMAVTSQSIAAVQARLEKLSERQRKVEDQQTYFRASAQTMAYSAKVAWALGGGVVVTLLTKVIQVVF